MENMTAKSSPPPKPVVLVADDIPENLTTLIEILDSDYQIRAARTGRQAIEMARLEPNPI